MSCDVPGTDFDVAGVTLASALAWLRGEVWASRAADLDTSKCEVAFLNEIGDRASYRPAVTATLALWDRGARAAIAHVCSPVFLAKYQRYGAIVTLHEPILWRGQTVPAVRLLVPAAGYRRWVEKMRVRTADVQSKRA